MLALKQAVVGSGYGQLSRLSATASDNGFRLRTQSNYSTKKADALPFWRSIRFSIS